MTELKITQADRDAAKSLLGRDDAGPSWWAIDSGNADSDRIVQAFARHRIAAEEGKAELVEALAELVDHRNRPPEHAHPDGAMGEIAMWRRASATLARVRGEG